MKRKYEEIIKGGLFNVSKYIDEKKVMGGAALASLAATGIKRSRALRIGGVIIPLFGAYCVVSAKFVYYAVKCAINEYESRLNKIDWQLKNCRK